jgi:hypothetical protein
MESERRTFALLASEACPGFGGRLFGFAACVLWDRWVRARPRRRRILTRIIPRLTLRDGMAVQQEGPRSKRMTTVARGRRKSGGVNAEL